MLEETEVAELLSGTTRLSMWIEFINRHHLKTIAEVGVARGEMALALLEGCPEITSYTLVDPWRHLDDWNKPANKDDAGFEVVYDQAMSRTSPWESKRIVLRGRTTEVIHLVPDESLDLAMSMRITPFGGSPSISFGCGARSSRVDSLVATTSARRSGSTGKDSSRPWCIRLLFISPKRWTLR